MIKFNKNRELTITSLSSQKECEMLKILCRSETIQIYLSKEEAFLEIKKQYHQPHRFYHNWENHILPLFELIEEIGDGEIKFYMTWTLLFHDIVYNPKSIANEQNSAIYFSDFVSRHDFRLLETEIEVIDFLIRNTDYNIQEIPSKKRQQNLGVNLERLSAIFRKLDFSYLRRPDFIDIEKLLFKEYQFMDWFEYRKKRISFLQDVRNKNITELISVLENVGIHRSCRYLANLEPKIGVFAGSFKPFHIGHLNILEQAEKVFDKVIIAQGKNTDKTNVKSYELPKSVQHYQYIEYDGLLSEFLDSFQYPVTLIRGLRNGNDLENEKDLQAWLEINSVCYFVSPREFQHISSSSIRSLEEKFPELVSQYLVE